MRLNSAQPELFQNMLQGQCYQRASFRVELKWKRISFLAVGVGERGGQEGDLSVIFHNTFKFSIKYNFFSV